MKVLDIKKLQQMDKREIKKEIRLLKEELKTETDYEIIKHKENSIDELQSAYDILDRMFILG